MAVLSELAAIGFSSRSESRTTPHAKKIGSMASARVPALSQPARNYNGSQSRNEMHCVGQADRFCKVRRNICAVGPQCPCAADCFKASLVVVEVAKPGGLASQGWQGLLMSRLSLEIQDLSFRRTIRIPSELSSPCCSYASRIGCPLRLGPTSLQLYATNTVGKTGNFTKFSKANAESRLWSATHELMWIQVIKVLVLIAITIQSCPGFFARPSVPHVDMLDSTCAVEDFRLYLVAGVRGSAEKALGGHAGPSIHCAHIAPRLASLVLRLCACHSIRRPTSAAQYSHLHL
ncbi:hypothetical protein CBOM_07823 [Ceraceosorus bombacis]|uniref:Uncharacterized protein n=1 Tax=Ceraceosorus bombacis TaxID=401625 RepID=A0A0P1BA34_9BASI|nr:hypothetical protein CBOM_07823 [Ceraceosorus bombacis]